MELRHLRYFIAAAEAENVSRAAARLHVSQPAVSRQIQDLEEELGFALFERSAKAVKLTHAGSVFLGEARAVVERAEQAVKLARAAAHGGHGELHVGYAPSPMARIMPATLRAHQLQHGNVRVKLHDLSTEEMVEQLRESRIELAFLVRPSAAMLRGLTFERLTDEPMLIGVAPNHPFARLSAVSLALAAQEPLIGFGRKEYPEYHEYLENLFARVKTKPRIVAEHDSAASVIAAVESGAGITVAPESLSCSAGPRLRLIPLSPPADPITVGMLWVKDKLTPTGKGFCEAAREAIAGLKR